MRKNDYKSIGNIVQWVKNSWVFSVLVILVLAFTVHCFAVINVLKRPPSPNFSREITLAKVNHGKTIYNQGQIAVGVSKTNDMIGIFSIDGEEVEFNYVNHKGQIMEQLNLPVDLSIAYNIQLYFLDDDEVTIIYENNGLYVMTIDLLSNSYTNKKILNDLKDYEVHNGLIVVLKEDGIYGLNHHKDFQETLIAHGNFLSMSSCLMENDLTILGIEKIDVLNTSGSLIKLNHNLEVLSNIKVLTNSNSQLVKKVSDLYYKDGIITSIFSWKNRKANENSITTIQFDAVTGEVISRFTNSSGFFFGDINVIDADNGAVTTIMQENLINGVNIVKRTYSEDKGIITIPLTKTRKTSILPFYYSFETEDILVFCDLHENERYINFASSDIELITSTTTFGSINVSQAVSESILIIIVSLVMAIPASIYIIPLPAISLLLINFFKKKYQFMQYFQFGIASLIHTIVQINLVATQVINNPKYNFMSETFIGGEPNIYIVLLIASILSIYCTYKYMKEKNEKSSVIGYLFYAIINIVLYAILVLSYGFTTMIVPKL